ncbi:MAG TPA: hypothetical protein VMU17_04830, partial [Elusimicrobiota bacterium]|nr:hypothetical protein [Elusimicrobiota bacterium]
MNYVQWVSARPDVNLGEHLAILMTALKAGGFDAMDQLIESIASNQLEPPAAPEALVDNDNPAAQVIETAVTRNGIWKMAQQAIARLSDALGQFRLPIWPEMASPIELNGLPIIGSDTAAPLDSRAPVALNFVLAQKAAMLAADDAGPTAYEIRPASFNPRPLADSGWNSDEIQLQGFQVVGDKVAWTLAQNLSVSETLGDPTWDAQDRVAMGVISTADLLLDAVRNRTLGDMSVDSQAAFLARMQAQLEYQIQNPGLGVELAVRERMRMMTERLRLAAARLLETDKPALLESYPDLVAAYRRVYSHTEIREGDTRIASILRPVFRPEAFRHEWQRALYFLLNGVVEEGIFRYLLMITWMYQPLAFQQHVNPYIAMGLAGVASGALFYILHPVVRWIVRAHRMGIVWTDNDFWNGLRKEISTEMKSTFERPNSLAMATLLITLGAGFWALHAPPLLVVSTVAAFHTVWDYLFEAPVWIDPLDSQRWGQSRQMRWMMRRPREQFSRTWFVNADLDGLGTLNTAFDKPGVGLIDRPSSPHVIFYRQSIYKEFSYWINAFCKSVGWKAHRGDGGDEIIPEPRIESSYSLGMKLKYVVQNYSAQLTGRYAYYTIGREALDPGEINRLERLPGALVLLEYGDEHVLSMDMKAFRQKFPEADAVAAIEACLLPDFKAQNHPAPMTMTAGAVSMEQTLRTLTRNGLSRDDYWLDENQRIRPERWDEFYAWGMRLSDFQVSIGKKNGKNRAVVAGNEDALPGGPQSSDDISALARHIADNRRQDVPMGHDWLTGSLTLNQLNQEFSRRP